MRISAINSNICCANSNRNRQKSFCGLIKDRAARSVINDMSESDLAEFQQIEKRLAKTKYWDMKISSAGNKYKDFTYQFVDKRNKSRVITDGIHPYDKSDNKIKIYSIVFGPKNISTSTIETLEYKSKERADEVYDNYVQNAQYIINRGYRLTPIESLKLKEIEINMLEEAAQLPKKRKNVISVSTEFQTKKSVGNDLIKGASD